MRRLLLAPLVAAVCLLSITAAEAAIRMRPANCPVAADASFKVVGARGELDGVRSEYQWLAKERPGWRRNAQALIQGTRGRLYDLLYISKGREKQVICFDITDFFGK